MSLQRRRERIIIINIWKIYNNIYPNSTNINFKFNSRLSSTQAIIKPLPKIRGKLLTLYDSSFTIIAAKLWNTIPSELRNIKSLSLFKNALDRFFVESP